MNWNDALAALAGANPPAEELASAMQRDSTLRKVWQIIWDKGHGEQYGDAKRERERLQGELDQAKQQVQQLQTDLQKAKEAQPDAQALHQQYGAEITQLKETHKQEKQQLLAQVEQRDRLRLAAQLEAKLVGKGVNPRMAKLVAKDPDVLARLQPQPDGKYNIRRPDKDLPYAVADGQDPLDLLVEEQLGTIGAEWIDDKAEAGGGAGGGGGGSGDSSAAGRTRTDGRASSYDKIAETARQRGAQAATPQSGWRDKASPTGSGWQQRGGAPPAGGAPGAGGSGGGSSAGGQAPPAGSKK